MKLKKIIRCLLGRATEQETVKQGAATQIRPSVLPESTEQPAEEQQVQSTNNVKSQNQSTMKTSELVLNFLKEQGLMPEKLDNGNLVFKYQMRTFVYVENDEDSSYLQFVMPGIFDVTDDNRDVAMVAANATCIRVKIAKAIVTDDDVCIAAECFIDSTPVFEDMVPRLLDILLAGQQMFYDQLNS